MGKPSYFLSESLPSGRRLLVLDPISAEPQYIAVQPGDEDFALWFAADWEAKCLNALGRALVRRIHSRGLR